MSKTFDSIVMLKTVSIIVAFTFAMLSLGVPLWQSVYAANVQEFSNTLSDSAPSAPANHTIVFTTPSGMSAGGTITITLEDFDLGVIDPGDFEVEVDGVDVTSEFTLTVAGDDLEFEADGSTSISANDEVIIRIGENTASGTEQITNPSSTGSYPIQVDLTGDDSGETRIAIVDAVEVTASVDTIFTFTIAGVTAGDVNGDTISGETTATAVPFGTLEAGQASTTAQDLSVETNAVNGFAVTVQTDGPLQSAPGNTIAGFIDGSDTTTPSAWVAPTPDLQDSNTWGHWGLTTEDSTQSFGASNYVAVTTDPVVVFSNDGPSDGITADVGQTRVGYKIEVSALQPAGEYTTTLTYIATPVF